jgi:hypothetical protein
VAVAAVVLMGLGALVWSAGDSSPAPGSAEFVRVADQAFGKQKLADDDDDEDGGSSAAETKAQAKAKETTKAGARAHAKAKAKWRAKARARAAARSQAAATSSAAASSGTGTVGSGPTPGAGPVLPPPPPSRPGGGSGHLSWAPPAGYQSFPVRQVTGQGSTSVDGKGKDVRIELPADHPVGPIAIKNCRNAVLIGGSIKVLPTATVDGQDQRGIYIKGCTGTVHIEGVLIDGAVPGSQSDGITVNAPDAVVQIENVRVEGLLGAKSGNHADVFQPWGGVREFRIDRLTGSSNYQGLHIGVDLGPIGGGTIRNTNIVGTSDGNVDKGGQYIWMDCDAYPLTLDNVFISGRTDRGFEHSIWPQAGNSGCGAKISGGTASWPGYASLSGGVNEGRPASGDFVPAGSVGLGYTTTGYL